MKKPVNPAILGAFVVGAISVLIAAIMVFGGGGFFAYRPRFVAYFPGSVQGLTVGAPLLFRGVEVGTVREIQAIYESSSNIVQIPVTLELDRDKISGMDPPIRTKEGQQEYVLKSGLRVQLVSQSFVTGQKAVALDFKPDTEAKLHNLIMPYAEVPAIPSPLDKFSEKLENFPLEKLSQLLEQALVSIHRITTDPELEEGIREGAGAMKEIRALVSVWADRSVSMSTNADQILSELKTKVHAANIEQISADFSAVSKRADKIMGDIDRLTVPGAPLEAAVREFAGAARELRGLLEYLSRHPEALVSGRSGPK